jgi:hypothetical protein
MPMPVSGPGMPMPVAPQAPSSGSRAIRPMSSPGRYQGKPLSIDPALVERLGSPFSH